MYSGQDILVQACEHDSMDIHALTRLYMNTHTQECVHVPKLKQPTKYMHFNKMSG